MIDRLSANPTSYEFQITEPPTTSQVLAFGAAAAGELTEAGERHTYTFAATSGQVLYYDALDADQQGTIVELARPDGTLVADIISNVDGPAFQLPVDGQYRLSVTGDGLGLGTYSFRLIDLTNQTDVPLGEPLAASLQQLNGGGAGAGDSVFRLSAPGPGEWILDFTPFTNPEDTAWWTLYDVASGRALQSDLGLWGSTSLTLPHAGNYALAFENPGTPVNFQFQLNGPPNTPPQIGEISDRTVSAGLTAVIGLNMHDEETPTGELTVFATSSDDTLIPETGLVTENHSSFWTLAITPAAGESGSATLTVTVVDQAGSTASESFVLTVTPAISPTPWRNARNHFDVNDDDAVVPLDVLIIVNKLNRDGPGELPAIAEHPDYYYDVSGDNFISPLDALQIINYLNGPGALGEGDSKTVIRSSITAAAETAVAARATWWNFANPNRVIGDRDDSPQQALQSLNYLNANKLADTRLEKLPARSSSLLGALPVEAVDMLLAGFESEELLSLVTGSDSLSRRAAINELFSDDELLNIEKLVQDLLSGYDEERHPG